MILNVTSITVADFEDPEEVRDWFEANQDITVDHVINNGNVVMIFWA